MIYIFYFYTIILNILKNKLNEIEKTDDKEKVKEKQIEIYSIILGYYAARRDKGPYILPDRFDEILNRIQKLCNLKKKDLEFDDCTMNKVLEYANYLINSKTWSTETCSKFLDLFFKGYDHYQVKDSTKFINNLTIKKHKKIQKKLNEFI